VNTASASTALPRAEAPGRHTWIVAALALLFGAAGAGYGIAMGEFQALWVALAAAACVAVLIDFRLGAIFLVALLPVSTTAVFPRALMGIPALNPINVLLAGALGAYLLRGRLQRRGPFVPRPLLWLYIVPIVAAGLHGTLYFDDIYPAFFDRLAVQFTTWQGYLALEVVKPMLIVAAALVIAAAVARAPKPEPYVGALAVGTCVLAFVMFGFIIAAEVTIPELSARRARPFFTQFGTHANELGRIFVTAYALLLFTWWETKHAASRLMLFAVLGVICLGISLTFSRNAFLGSFIVSALFVMWKFNAKKLALGLGAAAVAVAISPQAVWRRITYRFDTGSADAVSAGRVEGIWTPLLPDTLNSPIWGQGLDSIMWSDALYSGAMDFVGHPHNAYLQALLDMGVLGLALLVAYYLHVWKGFRALGSNAYLTPLMRGFFQGGCAALVAFAVAGMSGGSLRPDNENIPLWIAIGIMYGLAARRPAS
jgi:O-antigen ligase